MGAGAGAGADAGAGAGAGAGAEVGAVAGAGVGVGAGVCLDLGSSGFVEGSLGLAGYDFLVSLPRACAMRSDSERISYFIWPAAW